MERHVLCAAALTLSLAVGITPNFAAAQGGMFARNGNATARPTSRPAPKTGMGMRPKFSGVRTAAMQPEPLPEPVHARMNGPMNAPMGGHMEGHTGGPGMHYSDGEYYEGGPAYGGESFGGYGYGGCECDAGGYGCDECYPGGECCESNSSSWWDCCSDCCGIGDDGQQRRWYVMADYLYVRASFSEAVAYLEQNTDDPFDSRDEYHELDFQHDSSYRIGAGYQLGCCDEELRFMFTRMTSYAEAEAPIGAFTPYRSESPDSPTFIHADVDSKSWDLDYRKTIPLGGTASGCGDVCCGDPCGCGDACCAPPCPAWDITWSGGLRFADVDWYRRYESFLTNGATFTETESSLSFEGGGPKIGLEGRRYFGQKNWCSAYLKGDVSVLLGQMHHQVTRDDPDSTITQTAQGRRVIPVTELEAGVTAQMTKGLQASTGYLFSAWHDLGFRDQTDFVSLGDSQLPDSYDDANILGWDGFFARLEYCY